MPGRGRPRKAESPKSDGAGGETPPNGRPRNGPPEEEQNGTTREKKAKEKESRENTKALVQGAKPKTFAGRASSTEQSAEQIRKPQPLTPKVSIKATKTKTCSSAAKSSEQLEEKTETTPPEAPQVTIETAKRSTKARVARHASGDVSAVDSTLLTTLEQLKIKMKEKSNAAEVVNRVTENIIRHLRQRTQYFRQVEPLRTGSYYENVKISHPDEFDIMMCVAVDRVDVEPFGDSGAYYSVALKRGNNPLKDFLCNPLEDFPERDTLSASKMLDEFRKEVKKSVTPFAEWKMERKKPGCPAVTMTTDVQSVTISLDVVLCLKVKSRWPLFTKEGFKIEGWLGTKVKKNYKYTPFYLVPKYEGIGTVEHDGVLARDCWRVSFSHVEKDILRNHGSEKTCCEKNGNPCCRKNCLKLLKHLLNLLKEKNSSFDKFYSYHAKTTLLHACCTRTKDSDWEASSLTQCFQQLLDDFVGHLEKGELPNFFIPGQNLLSGPSKKNRNLLAQRIKEQCDNGFPIFKMLDMQPHSI